MSDEHPVQPRELWMLMHPSAREVRRIDVVATWLTERVYAFLATTGRDAADARAKRGVSGDAVPPHR